MKKTTHIYKLISSILLLCLAIVCYSFFSLNSNNNYGSSSNLKKPDSGLQKRFVIYDGILQKNKPDLSPYGIKRINIIYEDSLLNSGKINYSKLDHEIQKASKNDDPICLDIESWDLTGTDYQANAEKYITVFNYFKGKLPKRQIGYFGMLPHRDIYLYKQRSGANSLKRINYLAQWLTMNNNIRSITANNDFAFPAFYTRNNSMPLWKWATDQQIAKLKKMDPTIPVYGFVWPQYWNNNKFTTAEDWRFQLETLYPNCDGLIIWAPPFNLSTREPIQWDSSREWWTETLKFMKDHNIK
ncbi:MAG: hypothetical protein J7599_15255 [Niabella sp.]|nr:hypothetical protein [Niabella sp.]